MRPHYHNFTYAAAALASKTKHGVVRNTLIGLQITLCFRYGRQRKQGGLVDMFIMRRCDTAGAASHSRAYLFKEAQKEMAYNDNITAHQFVRDGLEAGGGGVIMYVCMVSSCVV